MNAMAKKQKQYKKKKDFGIQFDKWDFDGDLDSVIARLQEIKTSNPEFNEFNLVLEEGTDYDGEYVKYRLVGYRPETIEEKKDRLARQVEAKKAAKKRAEEAKKKQEADELKQLKELMEKYKDKVLGDEQ